MRHTKIGFLAIFILLEISLITIAFAQKNDPEQKSTNSKSTPSSLNQQNDDEEATSIREGVMTDAQRIHSKIYNDRVDLGLGRKIVDMLKTEDEISIVSDMCAGVIDGGGGYFAISDYVNRSSCNSDVIVVATVVSKESQLTDNGFYLFTDYTISIEEILKGEGNKSIRNAKKIVVTRLGGKVKLNNHIVTAHDTFAPLSIGSKYLFFLNDVPLTGAYKLVYDTDAIQMTYETDRLTARRLAHYKAPSAEFKELAKTAQQIQCPAKN